MKTRILTIVILTISLAINAQVATSSTGGANNSSWVIKGGTNNTPVVGPLSTIRVNGNSATSSGIEISSGIGNNNGQQSYGDLSFTSFGGFKAQLQNVFGGATNFSFTKKTFGSIVTTKFGIGTENPTVTLHLDNLGSRDGIKFGDKFIIRQNSSSDDAFFMENLVAGDVYIRSGFNPFQDNGNVILNDFGGNVGIGITNPSEKLTVDGKILCEEVEVVLDATAPDYVFEKYYNGVSNLKADYVMPTLEEVEAYTKANNHLPEVPSAKTLKEDGLELKDMSMILLQKIEELTLYTIEQEKRIKALETKLSKK